MFKSSYNLGQVLGIPVRVHFTFFLLLLLDFLSPATGASRLLYVTYVASIFGCVLLHELGHCVAAQNAGLKVNDILIWPFGGLASINGLDKTSPWNEFCVALAGPAVSIALAVFFTFVTVIICGLLGEPVPPPGLGHWHQFGSLLALGNLALAVFNLLPIYPMDGGRIFRAGLSACLGHRNGTLVACAVSIFLGFLVVLWGSSIGATFLMIIMLIMMLTATAEFLSKLYRFEDRS